jgi:NDP-sugar pyrophosphorylase family protein
MPTLVILAAGMSTRYGKLKQLEAVGPSGEALLDYGIHDALRAGFARIVLVIRRELEEAFRAHCDARWGAVPIAFAHQRLDQVPAGVVPPADRVKPWGTAHALLAAAPLVDGPCVVSNADDFYGPTAYASLAAHLAGAGDAHALVGYRLDDTLSEHGGVSRGVCVLDGDRVRGVTEILDIRRDGAELRGRAADGRLRELRGDTLVSMNLWGFRAAVFGILEEAFRAFLARPAAATAEFLLSSTLGELAAADRLRLSVLPTTERWMGVTHPDDREPVAARLRALVANGSYPPKLGSPS